MCNETVTRYLVRRANRKAGVIYSIGAACRLFAAAVIGALVWAVLILFFFGPVYW